MQNRKGGDLTGNPLNSVLGIILMILILVGLFYLARMVFRILYFLAPILLVATLILDHRIVLGYVKWLIDLMRRNVILGIGGVVLTFIGFPIVTAFLFVRALLNRNMRKTQQAMEKRRKGEFIEYEELDAGSLDLPEMPKQEKQGGLDELFDEDNPRG